MRCLVWITLLLQLGTAWAINDPGDPVYLSPRVWAIGNSVQIDIWNTTDTDVECSGSVIIFTRSGRTQNEYYWETIYRGFSRNRTFRLWDYNDQVTTAHPYINCRER